MLFASAPSLFAALIGRYEKLAAAPLSNSTGRQDPPAAHNLKALSNGRSESRSAPMPLRDLTNRALLFGSLLSECAPHHFGCSQDRSTSELASRRLRCGPASSRARPNWIRVRLQSQRARSIVRRPDKSGRLEARTSDSTGQSCERAGGRTDASSEHLCTCTACRALAIE